MDVNGMIVSSNALEIQKQIKEKLGLIMLECTLIKNETEGNHEVAEDVSNIEHAASAVGDLLKNL
jgi:hypothetical protein